MTTGSTPSNSTGQYRKLLTHQPHPLKSLDQLAVILPCHRGQEICCQGNPANHWYCVISGAARRCVIRLDGRRQIIDLFLPGDVFGFSASEEYDYTVEAVAEGTVVASYPRRRVEMLADADPLLGREIRQVAFLALARLQAQLLILGRITALERLALSSSK
jgi:CRP/FNR family nitrogen fixation transcriptional regulator